MEITSVLTSVFALIFVISLIFIVSILLRKYGAGRIFVEGNEKNKRLSVKDTLIIDSRRKLVLISRDNTEHLILLSPDKEMIVESNITRDASTENNNTNVFENNSETK